MVVREIVSCDAYGHVTEEKDGEGRITRYYYGDNSSNLSNSATGLDHMFLTGVSRIVGSDSLTAKTDWDQNVGLKSNEEDGNGTKTSYTYDDYYRLTNIKNHSNTIVQRTDYSYSRDQSETGNFDATKPNYVRIVQFFSYGGSTDSTHTTTFTDGFGRKIQIQQRNGSNDIIHSWGYYPDGALRAEYAPYEISNATHAYHNTASYGSKDSTYFEYESDPRRRPYRATFQTMGKSVRPQTTITYAIASISGHKFLTRTTTDENSVAHKEWLNTDGTAFKVTTADSFAARALRDVRGLEVMILPPLASESDTSSYRTDIIQSLFGREIERGEPDQGTTKTVYDRSLRPIWVQEAANASGNDFWTTIYDGAGRVTRIGLEKNQNSNWYTRVPSEPTSTYGGDADEWRKKYDYDYDYFGASPTITDSSRGRLTRVQGNWDTNDAAEYYEYFQYSREGWITKQHPYNVGGVARDIEYEYDTGGRLRKVNYADAQSSEEFFIWYNYDAVGRLWKIKYNTTNNEPDSSLAEYSYNPCGQVNRVRIRNTSGNLVQDIDYSYNSRGFLKKINDPSNIGSDFFAMEAGYDSTVTNGPTGGWSQQNNGNISQIKWVNKGISADSLNYMFEYDSRNQLTKADCNDNTYDISSYSYDYNGNLTGRNAGTAWTYNYDGNEINTNRLDDISNRTADDNWDYDASGRQTKADTSGSMTSATYWFPGAAFHNITMSGNNLEMRYNTNNRRVQKKVVGGTTTNYVRDIGGNIIAVYEGTTLSERYIWGPTGLISIIVGNNSSITQYFTLTDHLGSIRTVVNATGETAVAGYDYLPYGDQMRSNIISGTGSRFQFGGKEFDTESYLNLYYFEARYYRPDIGRFVATDPARQGWSYYAYAGNNPIRFSDPNGMYYEEDYPGQFGDQYEEELIPEFDLGINWYAYGGRILMTDASGVLFTVGYGMWYDQWVVPRGGRLRLYDPLWGSGVFGARRSKNVTKKHCGVDVLLGKGVMVPAPVSNWYYFDGLDSQFGYRVHTYMIGPTGNTCELRVWHIDVPNDWVQGNRYWVDAGNPLGTVSTPTDYSNAWAGMPIHVHYAIYDPIAGGFWDPSPYLGFEAGLYPFIPYPPPRP